MTWSCRHNAYIQPPSRRLHNGHEGPADPTASSSIQLETKHVRSRKAVLTSGGQKRRLATVAVQSLRDVTHHGLRKRRCAAKLSFTLRRHPKRQVAGACLPMLHLAVGRQAKSLLRSLVRLLLRHSRNSLVNGIDTSQTTNPKQLPQVAKGDFFAKSKTQPKPSVRVP